MIKEKCTSKNIVILIILLVIAVLSSTVLSKYATSPENHISTIETLNEKKNTAMMLTAAVTVTSTAISAIPGDAATFIAQQISELADPLFIIVCTIYLEKFLLTTLGYISFNILIPIVCILAGIYVFNKKDVLKTFAIKLLIFAIAIYGIVPVSVKVMNMVEATFEKSINETYESVNSISEEAKNSVEDDDSNKFLDFLTSIGEGVTNLVESMKNSLGIFTDAVAVLIITTCMIPVVVLLFFIWLIKTLFGINISIPKLKKINGIDTPKFGRTKMNENSTLKLEETSD